MVRNINFQKGLLYKVLRLSVAIEQQVESELKVSFGLTFSQFKTLEALASGETTQRQLAERVGVSPAVITKQAEILAMRGLLTQDLNPSSKREKILKITDRGVAAVSEAGRVVLAVQTRLLAGIDLGTETTLVAAIDRMMEVQ